jgi:hypothetical protein
MHLRFLRQQLGVRQSTPNAVVLTELGELPLWLRWLKRAARLCNRLLAQPPGSLLRRALQSSITLALEAPAEQLARQSWAGALAVAMGAVGMPLDLRQPAAIGRRTAAALRPGTPPGAAGRGGHQGGSFRAVPLCAERAGGGRLEVEWHGRAKYLSVVRERRRRDALAQLLG